MAKPVSQRHVTGFEGTQELINTLQMISQDFSEKQANKFLVGAIRATMKPVLARARTLVAVDTGGLRASLQVEARRPTRRDRQSQYVYPGDVVVGFVTTASGNKLDKKKFKNVRTGQKQIGITRDARNIATEFGTANRSAKPYLRPALESQAGNATAILATEIGKQLQKYERNTR